MELRRTIAAFVLFALTALLSTPAFAGIAAEIGGEDEGCCCAEEKTNEHEEVEGPGCLCPSCACTIGEEPMQQPLYPTATELVPTFGDVTAPAAFHLPSPPVDEAALTIRAARGPPDDGTPPLYILYDTYLI